MGVRGGETEGGREGGREDKDDQPLLLLSAPS